MPTKSSVSATRLTVKAIVQTLDFNTFIAATGTETTHTVVDASPSADTDGGSPR